MITGMHAIVFSPKPTEVRAFFKDVLGLSSVDAGGGWLIFALPPAELAVHPSDGDGRHELYLMCDDIHATLAELQGKGIRSGTGRHRSGVGTASRNPPAGRLRNSPSTSLGTPHQWLRKPTDDEVRNSGRHRTLPVSSDAWRQPASGLSSAWSPRAPRRPGRAESDGCATARCRRSGGTLAIAAPRAVIGSGPARTASMSRTSPSAAAMRSRHSGARGVRGTAGGGPGPGRAPSPRAKFPASGWRGDLAGRGWPGPGWFLAAIPPRAGDPGTGRSARASKRSHGRWPREGGSKQQIGGHVPIVCLDTRPGKWQD